MIKSGLDYDEDNNLSSIETTSTQTLCDGADGNGIASTSYDQTSGILPLIFDDGTTFNTDD